jgi:hypothetical protein
MSRSATSLGPRLTATELAPFLRAVFEANLAAPDARTPVCIWGTHGIGKTESVEGAVRELGWKFQYLAPAQFEEMGDFLGMPRVDSQGRTVYATPEWVPTDEGPGVLLLDDINRADGRILRGIMQLLQRHETVAWALPKGWQIVATANPEGGDYAVTALDPAMLTRLLHCTLTFDVRAWARWAEAAGVDPRGIDFVLAYPELIGAERTTPRTLVQLFRFLARYPDWKKEATTVAYFAEACLDRETAAAFLTFVRRQGSPLPTAAEILSAEDFATRILPRLEQLVRVHAPAPDGDADGEDDAENRPGRDVDALLLLCQRVAEVAATTRGNAVSRAFSNLKALLIAPFLPADLRLIFARELTAKGALGKRLVGDPEVASILLAGSLDG